MTGPKIHQREDTGMISLATDELIGIEDDDNRTAVTMGHIADAIKRGVTPRRLEDAYRKNNVTILAGDCRVYRNALKALARRWGIDKSQREDA